MFIKLFLAFSIIPIVEIYILIKIGSIFGALTSILLVIFTGFAGAYLARKQGLKTFFRIQDSLIEGRLPSEELIDAVLILIAGFLLLTPGFLTDFFGFMFLFQTTRSFIKFWIQRKFRAKYMPNRPEETIIEQ
tara:strand:+ start:4076 stop:4474 length:399 start_codon:yes stop_codon:yes gene_type:complete